MDDRRILTVSELSTAIRGLLERNFPFVSVAGEISNLARPRSGHLYFTLKDQGAQIKAVLFKLQQRYLAEVPRDGVQVVCRGRISVYEPRGDYQLIVDALDFQGAGALPVTENVIHAAYAIPWFKKDRPAEIAAYAAAFRKVAEHADELREKRG